MSVATLTIEQAAPVEETWEQASSFYRAALAGGLDPEIVAGALALELDADPLFGAKLHECHGPRCENLTSDPVRDEQAVFWLGDGAETYCSNECMNNAGEAQAVPA